MLIYKNVITCGLSKAKGKDKVRGSTRKYELSFSLLKYFEKHKTILLCQKLRFNKRGWNKVPEGI